jgi:hypothetical protein
MTDHETINFTYLAQIQSLNSALTVALNRIKELETNYQTLLDDAVEMRTKDRDKRLK